MASNTIIIYTVQEIANFIGGNIQGDYNLTIDKLSEIESYHENSLCFLANDRYEHYLKDGSQRAIIVAKGYEPKGEFANLTLIRVSDVYEAWTQVQSLWTTDHRAKWNIDELSFVHESCLIDSKVSIGKFTVVSEGCNIGNQSVIMDQVFIGQNVQIGENVIIHPGVKIYHKTIIGDFVTIHANSVIGSDGFGYHFGNGKYHKIPQNGNVIIEDNVEIGANVCVDRASIGSTIIRNGAKLDNLIQIAHSVEIGEHVAIAAQAGIAGSARIGTGSQLGGQSGVAGHISLAPGSRIQAQSGISSNITKSNQKWYGSPILGYWDYLRSYAIFKNLPSIVKRFNLMEERIKEIIDNKD